ARAKQGIAVPFIDMRLIGDDGAESPWDGKTPGELEVRGPWVAGSYHAGAQGRWTADGWFQTGDVATIDPDGYMKICDRTKDLIKAGGEWIGSVDPGNPLAAPPWALEACVGAVPPPRWAERPWQWSSCATGPRRPPTSSSRFWANDSPNGGYPMASSSWRRS